MAFQDIEAEKQQLEVANRALTRVLGDAVELCEALMEPRDWDEFVTARARAQERFGQIVTRYVEAVRTC
jgi:hypothetical protein